MIKAQVKLLETRVTPIRNKLLQKYLMVGRIKAEVPQTKDLQFHFRVVVFGRECILNQQGKIVFRVIIALSNIANLQCL